MLFACRNNIDPKVVSTAANPGLLLTRYLTNAVSNSPVSQQARTSLFSAARGATTRVAVYPAAFARWEWAYRSSGATHVWGDFQTAGRVIIGFGGASPLEAGLTNHATYGLPYIPGTALKGLASHYCHSVWGAENPSYRAASQTGDPPGDAYRILFGSQDEGGLVVFHDGWLLPTSASTCLRDDVLTPHHSEYYMGQKDAPSDFDDPNPVTFLSVSGIFRLVVTAGHPDLPAEWVSRAFQLLTASLADWGVGGKTAAGYGRLIRK